MNRWLIFLLTLTPLIGMQSVQAGKATLPNAQNEDHPVLLWRTFHEQAFRYALARRAPNQNNAQDVAKLNAQKTKLEATTTALVNAKQLEHIDFPFDTKTLSNNQLQLFKYCYISVQDRFGESAAQAMFDLEAFAKAKQDAGKIVTLRIAVPAEFKKMLARILANTDLQNIPLPRPKPVDEMQTSAELWSHFYRSLERVEKQLEKLRRTNKASAIRTMDGVTGVTKALDKLVAKKQLIKKSYPFSIKQLSGEEREQYQKFSEQITGFDPIIARELLGIGFSSTLQHSFKVNIRINGKKQAGNPQQPQLTIYLPPSSFPQVSQFLDRIRIATQ